jgi:tRNA 5-methylaminomethyl-2-thiouridine biosynthesis bifunctional protein
MSDAAAALLDAGAVASRWRGRARFVVLVSGDDGVGALIATWRAWRDDAQRCERLHIVLVGAEPLGSTLARPDEEAQALHARLLAALPASTPNVRRIVFEEGRVQVLLHGKQPAIGLREIVASVDAFLIAATADEGSDPLSREPRMTKSIARLAAPGATLAMSGSTAIGVRALEAVGFEIDRIADRAAGHVIGARYGPRFAPRRLGARHGPRSGNSTAVIIGGGLAGCATAWALAEQGWHSTLLDRRMSIADAASGNAAGLFHGIVNGHDGTHARFHRAAALQAQAAVSIAVRRHAARGSLDGLLQLIDDERPIEEMRQLVDRLQLPAAYVQPLAAADASALAGLRLERRAWFYPGGGWVAPRELASAFLERAGPCATVRTGVAVAALRREANRWLLLDNGGQCIDSASTVVLANAGEAFRLAGGEWPVEPVRGQISMCAIGAVPLLRLPRIPITGAGYLLPQIDGRAIFGATSDRADGGDDVRRSDDGRNWAQLARLLPDCGAATLACPPHLEGRAGVRWVSRDRLPLIGGVPQPITTLFDAERGTARLDHPRFVPRQPGLFMFGALGSRGITSAALGGQVLAALITGSPAPIEADLLDAVDPARFQIRDRRRSMTG